MFTEAFEQAFCFSGGVLFVEGSSVLFELFVLLILDIKIFFKVILVIWLWLIEVVILGWYGWRFGDDSEFFVDCILDDEGSTSKLKLAST